MSSSPNPTAAPERAAALVVHVEDATIVISPHALDRYAERVRCGMSVFRARHDLEQISACATLTATRPAWKPPAADGSDDTTDAWLMLGEDVCFPVTWGDGELTAKTCLTRGTISDGARATRNRRRRARRHSQQTARRGTLRAVPDHRAGRHVYLEDLEAA